MEWLADIFGTGAAVVTGGLGGAFMRLVPEFFSILRNWTGRADRAADRAHELEMRRLDREIANDGGELKLREIEAGHYAASDASRWAALIEGLKAQAQLTGVRWADAWNISIRPGLTTAYTAVWVASRVFPNHVMWAPEDTMIYMGLLNFWFVGQVLDAARGPRLPR